MNTLSIAILVMCATAAFASAIPDRPVAVEAEEPLAPAPSEELLQGEEARWHGGGGRYYGGGGGGYYRGRGNYNRGRYSYHRPGWGHY